MSEVQQTITINCSAKEAFDSAIDPNNTHKWVEGVVYEEANESPAKLGTIYKNQSTDGSWIELEVTAFEPGSMFEMTKKGDSTHVRYTFSPVNDNQCELEYYVWIENGEVSERFSRANIQKILDKLKEVIEKLYAAS